MIGITIAIVLIIIAFISISYIIFLFFIKPKSKLEIIPAIAYLITLILSFLGFSANDTPYYIAIDPEADHCYSPISNDYLPLMGVLLLIYLMSLLINWKYGKSLPPLSFVILNSIILLGNLINILLILQFSKHDISTLGNYCRSSTGLLLYAPIGGLVVSGLLSIKLFKESFEELKEIEYKNTLLNNINTYLYYTEILPVWVFLFVLPISILLLFVLVLFGQTPDSLSKIFTDTTTWRFSQQTHPPILDHHGHYLCTVAARGNPEVVKPIHIGVRRGKAIIVNRQLQIANAFEEMVESFAPRLHKIIRGVYDKYGYNLSTKINDERSSNIIYYLMKPLEYFFLFCLYLFWCKPEELIKKQYAI